jgi:outer membrane protein OmpA-like peptidoglycan-associated protein
MKRLLIACSVLLSFGLYAQEEHNLVPNPSFEEVDGKIKDAGQIELAIPWMSATTAAVDLYSADAKNDQFEVPENKYGKEPARTGNNYVGVSFYGYRGRMPRTYLTTKLKNPLTEGRKYCMRFYVSLSDMSKYAANNLAMHVSKDSLLEGEGNISLDPTIKSFVNKPFEQQYLWTPICRIYQAGGGEQFITIGNFNSDEETATETLRLSRDFSGRQEYNAYYYIDDVSVIPMDVLDGDCQCDKIAGGVMEVENKSFSTDESQRSKAKKTYLVNSDGSKAAETAKKGSTAGGSAAAAAGTKEVKEEKAPYPASVEIMFVSKKFVPGSAEVAKLEKLADYLKSNPKMKLKIIGHADPSESEVAFIGKRRAFNVQKELIKNGISKERVPYESKETEMMKSDSDPSKNQRVSFQIL